MPYTLVSDTMVSSPPYTGDTEVGASTARGTAAAYYIDWDCNTTSGGSIAWDIYQVDAGGSVVAHDEHNTGTSCHTGFIYTHNFVAGADHISIVAHLTGAFSDWTGRFRVYYGTNLNYCGYGTEPNPSAQTYTYVTIALVDAVALALGGGVLLVTALDTLVGAPIVLGQVCGGPPPDVPTFTTDDFLPGTQIWSPGSYAKRWQALIAAVWSFYCQCTAGPSGSPAPVPYPAPPHVTGPIPTSGTQPIITCSNDDICATLNVIMRQLAAMNQQLLWTRSDVQLVQRQGVPFGYIAGPIHSALSNAGHFTVADILGLAVTFDVLPGTFPARPGDPDTYHQLGKISVGTADGWERSWQPTHSPYLILPVSGAVTLVGYYFAAGIVATITELIREP